MVTNQSSHSWCVSSYHWRDASAWMSATELPAHCSDAHVSTPLHTPLRLLGPKHLGDRSFCMRSSPPLQPGSTVAAIRALPVMKTITLWTILWGSASTHVWLLLAKACCDFYARLVCMQRFCSCGLGLFFPCEILPACDGFYYAEADIDASFFLPRWPDLDVGRRGGKPQRERRQHRPGLRVLWDSGRELPSGVRRCGAAAERR